MLTRLKRLLGSANERYLKKLKPLVARINNLESELMHLTDKDLAEQTVIFKKRLKEGAKLDDILPEAFATVREAARRVIGQRHYDVQLMGGIVLHRGLISEMKTGEGKTLVSTLPVYLNALEEKGVHVVTVNDYLATRDASWMGEIHRFLGLSVGCITHDMSDEARRKAYQADITYATNNELGFDYLRDNMKSRPEELVQRPFHFAIVDEVDSILIDEARTPLIISGPAEDSSDLYESVDSLMGALKEGDYEKDEKNRSVLLTEEGTNRIEELVRAKGLLKGAHLYDEFNITLVHHINQALKAHKIFAKDVDYIVKDNKVMLVDEFTGRIMDGRRYSDGLHQALEAKEGVPIQIENQTLASITYQNFFRLYKKLSGMTGTALTELVEFQEIYKLRVVAIPTNHTIQRKDHDDEVYRTFKEKADAVLSLIRKVHERKQPILVGTVSIEKSDLFSSILKKAGIAHQVLNARQHEKEASIIAEAGAPSAITIATNMAGRGTDIELGGSVKRRLLEATAGLTDEKKIQEAEKRIKAEYEKDRQTVLEAGGLFVIGTERHESRRIDNQLRGRSGRQGDPGASHFFLSLEDDLMRIFGSERLDDWLQKLGLKEGEAITHPWINRALEKAQQKVEARNFDMRKHLLKYDDVMNDQRKVVYAWRHALMSIGSISNKAVQTPFDIEKEMDLLATEWANEAMPVGTYKEQWTLDQLAARLSDDFGLRVTLAPSEAQENAARDEIKATLHKALMDRYAQQKKTFKEAWPEMERSICLYSIDHNWKEHLYALDHLRQGVHLRSYAQKDPLNEYRNEAFLLYRGFFTRTLYDIIKGVLTFDLGGSNHADSFNEDDAAITFSHPTPAPFKEAPLAQEGEESGVPPSRNAPCPCGSGKRYKNCHGKIEPSR